MQSEDDFIEEEISQQSSKPNSKASKRASNHDDEVINEEENLDPSHPETIIKGLEEQLKKWTQKFPINKFSINSANSFKHLVYKAEEKGETDKVNKSHLY
jgi:hypothetical protein